ncbi:hypothetical protein L1049_018722 [Liquidambar formosana]|uniref:Uncharacterized protein n=1 Tax=Liquidambar formosana TaxID=63359 RepID=A0AAP0WNR4_LIQFO
MRGIKVSSILRLGSKTLDLMEQLFGPPSLRSYFSEFISTLIFVFAGVGSAMSTAEIRLVAITVAHGFALFVAVYVAGNISGGHINPAVTFGLVVGGHVSILTGVCYCGAQLFGSTMACVLLMLAIPTNGLGPDVTGLGGVAMECIATFAVVYTMYAARDPRNGSHVVMGPVSIGFMYGANIIVLYHLTGGSMNPARSFGPSMITGDFRNHWVYWVGPLAGGGLAGLVYENLMSLANDQHSSVTNVA